MQPQETASVASDEDCLDALSDHERTRVRVHCGEHERRIAHAPIVVTTTWALPACPPLLKGSLDCIEIERHAFLFPAAT